MTKIVLTGTYVSDNRGDAAMQWTMIQELRRAAPDVEVVLHTPFPERDGPYYAGTRVVRSSRRQLVRATLRLAWLAGRRLLGLRGTRLLPSAELRELAAADLVIDLSGDMLTEAHGPHLTYSHFLPLMMAQLLGRPVYVCAQSIGPFGLTRPLARSVLSRATVTAREDVTRAWLRDKLGLDVERTADLAFLLEPAPHARVDAILRDEGVPEGRDLLGVSVSGIVARRFERAGAGRRFAEVMAAVLDDVQERTGATIVFVSHVTGPRASKDDRLVSRDVHARMRRGAHAFVLTSAYRSEELKGVIARCGAFVGARMHANIAALSSGVPVLAISYSHKTQGIMESLGMGEWVMDARDLASEQAAARAAALWSARGTLAPAIRSRLDDVRAASRRNVAIALGLIGRSVVAAPVRTAEASGGARG